MLHCGSRISIKRGSTATLAELVCKLHSQSMIKMMYSSRGGWDAANEGKRESLKGVLHRNVTGFVQFGVSSEGVPRGKGGIACGT